MLFSLGAVLLLARDLSDPTAILSSIATGGVAAALALFALAVAENGTSAGTVAIGASLPSFALSFIVYAGLRSILVPRLAAVRR